MANEVKELNLRELQEMIEAASNEGLLMCMTDAEVNDIKKE